MRKLLLLAFGILAVLAYNLPVAQSHAAGNWISNVRSQETVVYALDVDNSWSPSEINGVEGAIEAVDDISGTPSLNLVLAANEQEWDGCGGNTYNIIEKVGSGTIGATDFCTGGAQDLITEAHITIVANGGTDYYWGADALEPNGKVGVRGVLVHEILHSLGFGFTAWDDSCGSGGYGHWNTGYNCAGAGAANTHCDQTGTPQEFHTMCLGFFMNLYGTYSGETNAAQENRLISLEEHDIHVLQDSY